MHLNLIPFHVFFLIKSNADRDMFSFFLYTVTSYLFLDNKMMLEKCRKRSISPPSLWCLWFALCNVLGIIHIWLQYMLPLHLDAFFPILLYLHLLLTA